MSRTTAFEDFTKAQNIMIEAIEKSARANLATAEKMLESNRERFAELQGATSPAEYVARQSTAFKEAADEMNQQFEALVEIGNDSREQLIELGQNFARNMDFGSLFDFAPPKSGAKAKGKTQKAA